MKIATWNLARKRPSAPLGRVGIQHLQCLEPDVMVLTEAREDHLGGAIHHADGGPTGIAHLAPDERKVVIASRWPLHAVSTGLDVPTPGRFVSAVAERPDGPVRIIGVCIPWFASRVKSGLASQWEDHRRFLKALGPVLVEAAGKSESLVVAGDFNQRIPRGTQPVDVSDLMAQVFKPLQVVTGGVRPETRRQLIDHIACSRGLRAARVTCWDGKFDAGRVSDHDGVMVEVQGMDQLAGRMLVETAPSGR